jgi:hypothetical protein
VDLIARRFRGAAIAIVVLGLSAGAVFAGHVVLQAPATTPTTAEQGDQNDQGDENANETPEPAETPEAPEAPDANTPDLTGVPGDNHGALVSAAAQMPTPVAAAGGLQFANHGEFVSCVAHVKTLPTGMTVAAFLATVTPESCALMAAADQSAKVHGKSGQHGKGHKHG